MILASIVHKSSLRNSAGTTRDRDDSPRILRGQRILTFMRLRGPIRLSCWILLFSLFPIRVLAFDYFEHRYLGNHAYLESTKDRANWNQTFKDNLRQVEHELGFMGMEKEICDALGQPKAPTLPTFCKSGKNADHQKQALMLDTIPVGFGDLSALAGDHAENSTDLEEMVEAFAKPAPADEARQRILVTRRHWINACRWYQSSIGVAKTDLQSLNACFANRSGTVQTRSSDLPGATPGYVPSRLELAEFEQLPNYVDLVGSNKSHFPMHSWKAYVDHHLAALDKAAQYRTGIYLIGETAVRSLKQALIHEGIAQHFLQDSFAAGHIASQYGSCWIKLRIELFCFPSKPALQHSHDYLNGLGISVTKLRNGANAGEQPSISDKTFYTLESDTAPDSRQNPKVWRAFGDRHLFIPEAAEHRSIIEQITTQSLQSVLDAAITPQPGTRMEVCEQWLPSFPIPSTSQKGKTWSPKECAGGENTQDLSLWKTGRSPDPQVPDVPLEGWKFLVTWGSLLGKFTHLNQDGSSRTPRGSITAFTFELGYVRPTGPWKPNYFGVGMAIAPGNRMSIYPVSVGKWWANPDLCSWFEISCFAGIRANGGIRLTEPFSAENPSAHRNDIFEFNIPFDFGVEVYPPITLYVRTDLLTVGLPVISDPHSWEVDSIFAGRGALTGGIRYDLAGILP